MLPTRRENDQAAAEQRPLTGRGSRRLTVAEAIQRFSPKSVPPAVWARIEGVAKEWASRSEPVDPTNAVTVCSVVAQLLWWADGEGEPLEAPVLLHPEMVDRFLATGCQHLVEGTQASYRTHLRKVGRGMLGPALFPFPTHGIPAQDPQRPYSEEEIAAQRSWVRGLPTERMRRNCLVLLSLGLGAGLVAQEMASLQGTDVTRDDSGVRIRVRGRKARSVPVLKSWENTVFDLADEVGEKFVFRPDREKAEKHQTSNFVARCAQSAGAPPAFSLKRLRGTWIVAHLVAGIPPNELAKVAGIQKTQLGKYFNLMPDIDPEVMRNWLRMGGRR